MVGGETNTNWSAAQIADVPPAVVTRTSATPATSAGVTTEIDVPAALTANAMTVIPPNEMATAPPRLLPVMVMAVPPATGPAGTLMDVTTGAGMMYVKLSADDVEELP